MNVIICVDETGGMLFNKRRQSQDSLLREKVLELVGDAKLYMSKYSAKQFLLDDRIVVSDNFLELAGKDDFCFVENVCISLENVKRFFIFNWNRRYPSDVRFDFDIITKSFKKISTEDFIGNSHDKITLDIYERCFS